MKEFRVCPTCGYARGFHTSYRMVNGTCSIIFICPDCGSAFDLQLSEDRIREGTEAVKVGQYGEKE